jgi:hypothetical protein
MDTQQVRPHAADLLSLSTTIEDVRLISLHRPIPHYPKLADSTAPYSHSIVPGGLLVVHHPVRPFTSLMIRRHRADEPHVEPVEIRRHAVGRLHCA